MEALRAQPETLLGPRQNLLIHKLLGIHSGWTLLSNFKRSSLNYPESLKAVSEYRLAFGTPASPSGVYIHVLGFYVNLGCSCLLVPMIDVEVSRWLLLVLTRKEHAIYGTYLYTLHRASSASSLGTQFSNVGHLWWSHFGSFMCV